MIQAKENPGALAGATGAEMPDQATAAGIGKIAQKPRKMKAGTPYRITPSAGGDPFRIVVGGRFALTEAQAQAIAALVWGAGQ